MRCGRGLRGTAPGPAEAGARRPVLAVKVSWMKGCAAAVRSALDTMLHGAAVPLCVCTQSRGHPPVGMHCTSKRQLEGRHETSALET